MAVTETAGKESVVVIKVRKRSLFSVGALAMLLLAFIAASALGSDESGIAQTSNAGVLRAEAAGIKIDPAAAQIMQAAPLGSCLNDPTQPKCASVRPTAIVGTTGSAYAPLSVANPAPSAPATGTIPSAQVPQCAVGATQLYDSGNHMYAEGENSCAATVSAQQLFVSLESLWNDGAWHIEDTGSTPVESGGKTISAWAYWTCNVLAWRQWKNVSQGYSELNGVWYAAQNVKGPSSFVCVG